MSRVANHSGRHLNNLRAQVVLPGVLYCTLCQEEEDRLYNNATHPRVAMLKNTNIESEMLARWERREQEGVGGSRREQEGAGGSRRKQEGAGGSRKEQEGEGGSRREQDTPVSGEYY